MPELPDVEGWRRALAKELPGQRIKHVTVTDGGILRNATPQSAVRRLVGHRFGEPGRVGKWLILPTDGPVLLIHSGMTGHPYFTSSSQAREAHERLTLTLDQGEFRYADLRKLRGLWIVDDVGVPVVIGSQGPDALSIEWESFANILQGKRGILKSALMDQSVLAGLGNMLSDEICWQARLSPIGAIANLDDADIRRLYLTMRRVLRTAVRHGRIPRLRSWLSSVRTVPDPACPRCGTPLHRGRASGRTALWCPSCQPR
ncbi:MAG TPA: DNA-formamidopyrimidine glycosylase family protein [Acidimicrobiales bacterium]|jgi:formamidopyrimidine-DNA glycosylase|nr:DNA-formamidopyrimidine glycosylase family protein [Acidimicrobiales bacterium]